MIERFSGMCEILGLVPETTENIKDNIGNKNKNLHEVWYNWFKRAYSTS